MLKIVKQSKNEFYISIPTQWNRTITSWNLLPVSIENLLSEDVTVYIDLKYIDKLESLKFDILYELVKLANSRKSKIVFMNKQDHISEKIGLLSYSSE
jgi:hypothetical protein